MSDITSPISYEMEKKRRDVEAAKLLAAQKSLPISSIPNGWSPDISQISTSRVLLQPAHGPNYVNPVSGLPEAPGIGYIPAPAQEVTRGMGIMDVSSKPTGTGDLPIGFARDAAGVLRPTGQSTLAGTIVPAPPVQVASPALSETAVPAGKPVGPVGQTLTETPVARASQSRMERDIFAGPMQPQPSRFERDARGNLVQINPEAPGIFNEATRRGIGIADTGMVPGGNVSQASVDPETQKRLDEEMVAWKAKQDQGGLSERDKIVMMEGAHGPAEAARVQRQIASIDQVHATKRGDQAKSALEGELARATIFEKTASAYDKLGLVTKDNKFNREATMAKFMEKPNADPVKATKLTNILENMYSKKYQPVSTTMSILDENGSNPMQVKIAGAVPPQSVKKYQNEFTRLADAQKAYSDSGFMGMGKGDAFNNFKKVRQSVLAELEKDGFVIDTPDGMS